MYFDIEKYEYFQMKKIFPCVIGLGYVGLPVFVSLKKKFNVTGYDVNKKRVYNLNNLVDTNKEFSKNGLKIKNQSLITNKFILDTTTASVKESLTEFKKQIKPFITSQDRLRLLTRDVFKNW